MFKKIFTLSLILVLFQTNFVFARTMNDHEMLKKETAREEVANKNLKSLFHISLDNNKGSDKDMMDILQKYIFADVFTTGNLDIKKRELLTVTTLTVQQTLPQLKAHINAALNVGNTPVEIHETIYHCAPFIGFPKTLNALAVFNDVLKERNIETDFSKLKTVDEKNRYEKGYEIQHPIYGDEIRNMLKDLPDDMGDKVADYLTEVCFGDFYTRKGLDIRTRELLTIGILATTGNTVTLKSHIMGSLKVGNSREDITSAIIQVMPYVGFANSFTALKTAKEVFNNMPVKP